MGIFQTTWPEEFTNNVTNFLDRDLDATLAMQLCAWGNVYMGAIRPDNFFEVMDGASKLTEAFTPEECHARANILLAARKNKGSGSQD
jgi:hypothetical protein